MKKIPTLFRREFYNHRVVKVLDEVTPGMEWVLNGEGVATVKLDGACCATIGGKFYKRYDAKQGKKPPEGAIPCCDPDPVTGHWPHWVEVDASNKSDRWLAMAFLHTPVDILCSYPDGTWEAVGPHFQGNPYALPDDRLERHGEIRINVERSFEGIRDYLATHAIEGIVFWKDDEPRCKIKRTDFGLKWPVAYAGIPKSEF